MDSHPFETIGQLYEANLKAAESCGMKEVLLEVLASQLRVIDGVDFTLDEFAPITSEDLTLALERFFSVPRAERRKFPYGALEDEDRHPDIKMLRKARAIHILKGLGTSIPELEARLRSYQEDWTRETNLMEVYDSLRTLSERWPSIASLLQEAYQSLEVSQIIAQPIGSHFSHFNIYEDQPPASGILRWLPKGAHAEWKKTSSGELVQVYSFSTAPEGEGSWVLATEDETSFLRLTKANGSSTLRSGWLFKQRA